MLNVYKIVSGKELGLQSSTFFKKEGITWGHFLKLLKSR
jgi:hypothetical protein